MERIVATLRVETRRVASLLANAFRVRSIVWLAGKASTQPVCSYVRSPSEKHE